MDDRRPSPRCWVSTFVAMRANASALSLRRAPQILPSLLSLPFHSLPPPVLATSRAVFEWKGPLRCAQIPPTRRSHRPGRAASVGTKTFGGTAKRSGWQPKDRVCSVSPFLSPWTGGKMYHFPSVVVEVTFPAGIRTHPWQETPASVDCTCRTFSSTCRSTVALDAQA